MRFSKMILILPVLLCTVQMGPPVSSALAAPMDAKQATELLAKSHVINVKCGVLSADQSQDLKDFVARAEISLAEKASVSVARKTIAGGRALGNGAVCDDAAKKLVNDVLAAANAATLEPVADQTTAAPAPKMAAVAPSTIPAEPENTSVKAVATVEPAPAPKPVKSATLIKPKPAAKPVKPAKLVKAVKPERTAKVIKTVKNLKGYASVVEKYYVATRCGNMSRKAINALYQEVLINHKQALASNRAGNVRATLQSAEARAGSKSCS